VSEGGDGRPTAMVTGASRGIGRAIALALAEAGYDVAITARTVEEGSGPAGLPGSLTSTAAEIEGRGRRALRVPLDLLDRAALGPAVDAVTEAWGRLDVLVNNAIYVGPGNDERFLDVDPEHLERRVFANLTAQLLLSQRALRAMVAAGSGTVVNITSGAAVSDPPSPVGEGGWALGYGCAKGGFHRMAGIVAVELGPAGIRCFNVEPGFVATERVQADPSLRWVASRGKSPEVVGGVVAWLLAQPDGAVPNGSTVSVDEAAARLPGFRGR
jgi:NAD(P)-dependent dehydrogenase (short-subunit alcohol dehydrogenase family)